jgi:hypothetical protein
MFEVFNFEPLCLEIASQHVKLALKKKPQDFRLETFDLKGTIRYTLTIFGATERFTASKRELKMLFGVLPILIIFIVKSKITTI